jgi:hypothetical protein
MNHSQLLCTFCTTETLDDTLKKVVGTYKIVFGVIYVLENVENSSSLCCTYNVDTAVDLKGQIPEGTISLHRKKLTNTLYTINALNLLIAELNNGIVDKSFKINWDDHKNMILVAAYNKLKKINTKLNQIVEVKDILKFE